MIGVLRVVAMKTHAVEKLCRRLKSVSSAPVMRIAMIPRAKTSSNASSDASMRVATRAHAVKTVQEKTTRATRMPA